MRAELIADLAKAGLVSVEVDDDGAVWYALTSAGRKVARQMAMRRDARALVLLGALFGASEYPN
jgi:DNA-binding PadR family transcriptional regulator